MLAFAAQEPEPKYRAILGQGLSTFGIGNASPFGIRINTPMIEVPFFQNDFPVIQYDRRVRPEMDSKGSWNLKGLKFTTRKVMPKWAIISVDSPRQLSVLNDGQGRPLISQFTSKIGNYVDGADKTVVGCFRIQKDTPGWEVALSKIITVAKVQKGCKLCLVVLPQRDTNLYQIVKKAADLEIGIHCVCITAKNFRASVVGLVANVAMKFNLKLGGANQVLAPTSLPSFAQDTLFIGLDVTHPAPGASSKGPSIAAMVGNIDANLAQWPGGFVEEEPDEKEGKREIPEVKEDPDKKKGSKEILEPSKLEALFKGCLDRYISNTKRVPQRIFVYRDGVSEGQYKLVLEKEKPVFDKVCKAKLGKELPMALVIVAKRHHTRAFKVVKQGDRTTVYNPSAGTVFDRGVTMDRGHDFFLQAHHPLKGTGKPAHYVVLHSGFPMAPKDLEKFSHDFSYLFGRSTLPVSLPPAIYYADLLAYRARAYLARLGAQNLPQTVHADVAHSMFYI